MNIKKIVGLASLCLLAAIIASALTAVLLLKGLIVPGIPDPGQTTKTAEPTSASTLPTIQTTVLPTPSPSPSPSPSPGASPSPTAKPTPTPTPQPSPSPTPTPTVSPSATSAVDMFYLWQTRDLLERIYTNVAPSVVGIKIEVTTSGGSKLTNEGSGLMITGDGDIATNASLLSIAIDKQGKVLAGAQINVLMHGVSISFPATLVGRDLMTGLAVLHIDAGLYETKPAKFAENPDLKVGQMILFLGYPDQYYSAGVMTSGMISSLNQPIVLEDGTTLQMIQTNAPISQASSGGPLLNLAGEVIGLSNGTLSRESGDFMSYALPAATVRQICLGLIEKGYVSGRAWLGVSILTEQSFLDLQKLYHLPDGLFISNIIKDSPAYSVDLRKGDVITRINGKNVAPSMDLGRFLQSQPVGSLVTIRVYRRSDGLYHEIDVYLQEYKG
jgi:serine protease Do